MELKMELSEKEKEHGKWFILHYLNNNLKTKPLKVEAPKDYFYADPFVLKHNELHYVFFEHFDYNKGKLAYYTIDSKNNISKPEFLEININVHTSYPMIFEYEKTFYMIPETCHLNKINLYKCTNFPKKWEFVKTLVDNVHASDTTILFNNNKVWLFSTVYKNNRNNLCIYHSNDLIDNNFIEHKIINTSTTNVKNDSLSRSAGNIYLDKNKIIRPAQYSDRGINGEGIILYEIKNLDETSYHEVPIDIISCNEIKNIRATHSLSRSEKIITFDGRLERNSDQKYEKINKEKELLRIMDNNYYVNHNILKEAFSLNTSGNGKCYYQTKLNNVLYAGERDWDLRWNLLKDIIDYNNQNVLEIGCNMGIFINYLKKFRNINKAVGVDQPDHMLIQSNKKDTIKAAKLLTKGLLLKEDSIEYKQLDLNSENYEQIIGENFDIVIAMSIYKWIEDKDRFLKYLSKFNTIIYEGHDSDEEEIKRFSNFGFKNQIIGKTQVGASYNKDSYRSMILFTK